MDWISYAQIPNIGRWINAIGSQPRALSSAQNVILLSYLMYSAKNIKHFIAQPMDTVAFYIHGDQNYLLDNYHSDLFI